MRKRNIQLKICVSEEEKQKLEELCEASGRTQSALLRNMIMGYRLCEKPDREFYKDMMTMNRLASNINFIRIKVLQEGLSCYDEELLRTCEQVRKFVSDMREKYLLPKEENMDDYYDG